MLRVRILILQLMAAVAACACWAWAAPALAQTETPIIHVVRPGETLASIAELYYGNPRRETVIVAENGLGSEGGSSIVTGLRLVIPTVHYHRVTETDTWNALAERYYGDVRRAFLLMEANGQNGSKPPDLGAELLVPYPLRQVVTSHDALRQISKDFYDGGNKDIQTVRRFNAMKTSRADRGQILLVPIADLVLSATGKKIVEAEQPGVAAQGDLREKQLRIRDELPQLHSYVEHGRYVEAVATANRLIGMGDLTGNQIVSIERDLGTALIALDREDLALEAFKAMLEKQPDVELGLGTTSPKVLRVLEDAKKALADARAAAKASEPKTIDTPSINGKSPTSTKPSLGTETRASTHVDETSPRTSAQTVPPSSASSTAKPAAISGKPH